LSSADFGAVAAILHQSQRAGGFANRDFLASSI
jgi:hypothetical protein